MQKNFKIGLYGSDIEKETEACINILIDSNTSSVMVHNEEFSIKIIIPDIVDLGCFKDLLDKKEKKLRLLSHLKKGEKTYKGKKKFLWKDDRIVFSQGAVRFEFDELVIEEFKKIVRVIEESYNRV
ncbi:hypothetical protein GF327_00175 [Candidatus Woesearchaeota archaeon]|nr:hypothetical protein [Candidatus Woesearchaeota archaeon]